VVLRYTPKLKFVHDDSIERGNRILSIIEEIEEEPRRRHEAPPPRSSIAILQAIDCQQADHLRPSATSGPDGDCVGSQLGLALALKGEGKRRSPSGTRNPMPQKASFLDPDKTARRTPTRTEVRPAWIATDLRPVSSASCQGRRPCLAETRRGVQSTSIITRATRATATSTGFPRVNLPAANWIHRLLKEARWAITPQIANCLFAAGSRPTTGSFQYPQHRGPARSSSRPNSCGRGADVGPHLPGGLPLVSPAPRQTAPSMFTTVFHLKENDRVAYFWLRKEDFSRGPARCPMTAKD